MENSPSILLEWIRLAMPPRIRVHAVVRGGRWSAVMGTVRHGGRSHGERHLAGEIEIKIEIEVVCDNAERKGEAARCG